MRPPSEAPARAVVRRRALVDEVRDALAHDFLASGTVAAGSLLPSESELSARYGVSRVTLRSAMRSLQEVGLIASRHGVGWLVLPGADAGLQQGLDQLSSLETMAREAGQKVGTVDEQWEEVRADAQMAAKLGIGQRHRVLVVQRVKLLSSARVAWLVDYVPEGVIPFEALRAEFEGSILDILLRHPGLRVEYADTEIEPVSLPADIAARLDVDEGTAALFTDAVARTADGVTVEWAQSWLLPQYFRFRVRRRRHIGL